MENLPDWMSKIYSTHLGQNRNAGYERHLSCVFVQYQRRRWESDVQTAANHYKSTLAVNVLTESKLHNGSVQVGKFTHHNMKHAFANQLMLTAPPQNQTWSFPAGYWWRASLTWETAGSWWRSSSSSCVTWAACEQVYPSASPTRAASHRAGCRAKTRESDWPISALEIV